MSETSVSPTKADASIASALHTDLPCVTHRPQREVLRLTLRAVVGWASLLLSIVVLSLGGGLATAQASSPVGPHPAHWSTTFDSRVTLDLGPLGEAWCDSPIGILGMNVTLGENPSISHDGSFDIAGIGDFLTSDLSSYMDVLSHPEVTIEAGVRALVADALRRAGLLAFFMVCCVAVVSMLRHRRGQRRRPMTTSQFLVCVVAGVASLACLVTVVIPALSPQPVSAVHFSVVDGITLDDATLSGGIADLVRIYDSHR